MTHADISPEGQARLLSLWRREEQQPFRGWDFAYLSGRMSDDQPPWSYALRATELLRGASSVVDMGTGGGERLMELRDAWPPHVTATEEHPPNFQLATDRLAPLGVRVAAVRLTEIDPLPFIDAEFDVVLNRHSAFNCAEVARVLARGGTFLTQQVHGRSAEELQAAFGATPLWPEASPDRYVPRLAEAGLDIVNVQSWTGHVTFADVGALVYYLRAVPWFVPGFSVATHHEHLLRLQQRLDDGEAALTFPTRLYLIEAKRGLDQRTDARRIVAEGYDRIAETYATWSRLQVVDEVRPRYTSVLLEGLPPGARLLELGCGGGGPSTRQLAERFALTGVDISATQVTMARQNVPTATFLHQDMLTLDFGAETFDGVAAFYTLTHLPYGELAGFLRKMGGWVRAGGLLVATLSSRPNWGQVQPNWLGAPMYFSGYSVDDNTRFVEEAGFQIRTATVETIQEDGRPAAFLWIVAEKRPLDRQKTNGLFRKIDSVQIPVPDLKAGLAFYRDQLGHELIWRTSTSAGLRMPDTDAELVLQTQREQMETDLLVASADEAVAAIRRAGGQVAVEAFDIPIGRCAVVRDPWGNVLVLLDGTKGSLITDADGVVLTDASGAPRLKPRP